MSKRILVVDDNEYFRRTASELLAARGFGLVDLAADGAEAMAAAAAACPDGVLLDINLPGQDGFVIAAAFAEACPSARIVLTSADVEDVPGPALRSCGACAFVPKTELALADLHLLFAF